MPINDSKHWYFVKLEPTSLIVYDSLKKRTEGYLANPIFKNALRLGKNLYGVDLTFEVCSTYPQQDNGNDCGVFMLLGIRDILRAR